MTRIVPRTTWVFAICACCLAAVSAAMEPLALEGQWQFQLDPRDEGLQQQWFQKNLAQTIRLPGCLQAQGFGDDVTVDTKWTGQVVDRSWFTDAKYAKYREPGNLKIPFWLQPVKHYAGAAWYRRTIDVPPSAQGKRLTLSLERPHWGTQAWLDGRALGSCDSLSTPHVYELGSPAPGKHTLTVRVDNRMLVDVGENAHSVSDHTQSNWNGIVGRMEITATDRLWIDDVQVYPQPRDATALVKIRLHAADPLHGKGKLRLAAEAENAQRAHKVEPQSVDFTIDGQEAAVEVRYRLGNRVQLWDEFSPALYRLAVALELDTPAKLRDTRTAPFGMRDFRAEKTQFTINGRKVFLRGTLECCIFPKTGYPPTDVDSWKKILGACQAHGLNHMRFHSWCPPEAAFQAADELGVYFHVECAAWAKIGDGQPIDKWIYAEGDRILKCYGNHPCLVLMDYGNEPAGKQQKQYLAALVNSWKAKDPRRLYSSGSGWPLLSENQWHSAPQPRVQAWGAGLKSRINALPPETRTDYSDFVRKQSAPVVSHEIGQWCAYPNFAEIPKYSGYLKAKNFEIFRETLQANHMGDQAQAFLMASGKLQTLCYKEDIESALRTPGFGGFQLLDLHDFPGQGTALVGVLDPFWESKGYVTADEYRRFCNATVPLARMSKRVWTTDETLTADLEAAHFGPAPFRCTPLWKLVADDGRIIEYGRLPAIQLPVGNGTALGSIRVDLKDVPAAKKYRLVVDLEGTPFENDWDMWVYPARLNTAPPADVLVTNVFDAAAQSRLQSGGKVLLQLSPAQVKSPVAIGFSSIFWNTAWTRGQAPHTLGVLCNPRHAVFADFPTESHANWQWWELVHGSAAMVLDGLPAELRGLVQPIDTWFENRRLGLLVEARLGGGKLMIASVDLSNDLERRVVARQLRYSVLAYMAGDRFQPGVELTAEMVGRLAPGAVRP